MPTGKFNKADIIAMCSLPLPDAKESATSKSDLRCGRTFSSISFLKVIKSEEELTSAILMLGFRKGFDVDLSFTMMISSVSIRLISAEIWP